MTAGPSTRWTEVLPALVGISFAAAAFPADRGLWPDEAALGLNLPERGHAALLRPLSDGQAAPLLYLQIAKVCAEVFRRSQPPIRSEELRPEAQEVAGRIRPGERLWLNPDARYAFRFYRATGAYDFAGNEVTEGIHPASAEGASYEAQVAALGSDTWILLTHLREADVRRLLTGLTRQGLVATDSVKAHAAYAFRMANP